MMRLGMALVALVLVLAPLLLGGNRALFWAVNEFLVALALLTILLSKRFGSHAGRWDKSQLGLLLALFIAPVAWMGIQLVPNVPGVLAHPAWQNLPSSTPMITADPSATLLALLWWLPMAIVFAAAHIGRRSSRTNLVLLLMAFMGVFEAVFGLANLYFDWNTVGLTDQQAYRGFVTGTFVNRNSAATFMAIGLTALSCLTAIKLRELRTLHRRKGSFASTFLAATSSVSYNLAGMALIFVGLLLTGSRAGVITALIAQAVVFLMAVPKLTLQRAAWPAFAGVSLVLLTIAVSALLERAKGGAESAQSRISMAWDAVEVIKSRPLLGHGAGAYQAVEPITRLKELQDNFVINRPHNSYLEAAATLGVPFTVAWIAAFALLCFWMWRKRPRMFMPATTAFFAILVAESLHAFVDFSMQIQANAIYGATLLGLAIAESQRDESASR